MTLVSSLRSRIFLTSALLAVLSIGAAIYLVSVRVTRELEASLRRELNSNAALVDQLRTTRAQTFTTMARLIADAPKLKAAVDTNDPPTVQDTADGYQSQVNSNELLIIGKSGNILAVIGTARDTGVAVASQPAFHNALEGRESVSLSPQPSGILHLATVPIAVGLSHPDVLGTLSLGFLLDDAFAEQLKQLTGSDIAFGMDGRILASTLPFEHREGLVELLTVDRGPQDITLGTQEYAALALPMAAGAATSAEATTASAARPVALILRSRTEQLRFLDAIHTELAVTAVVAVLLATLLSFAVARTITRPLAAITSVMREVAASGDLTRKIVLRRGGRWNDEDALLLADTFNTLTSSIARAQREMSQKERLSSLGRLSTVIAHEVRNPLMIIKAALHTLRLPDLSASALREATADIDEEVVRLNRIVNDVLDLARPIRFEMAPTDLNSLCRESAEAAQVAPGSRVSLHLDPSLPQLTTDAERLRLALVNLIQNARQAVGVANETATAGARPGAPRSTAADSRLDESESAVIVTTRRESDAISIVVSDRGTGINPEDLPRVFDPYFTTKRGGTGLGLPIAKNIVEGLGGAIAVSSEHGRGTEIQITLPIDLSSNPTTDQRQGGADHTDTDSPTVRLGLFEPAHRPAPPTQHGSSA
jgi:signal transduction histidine kinase